MSIEKLTLSVPNALMQVFNAVNDGLERADVFAQDYRSDDKVASCTPYRISAYRVDSGRTIRLDITS